jgi:hypothetical protein
MSETVTGALLVALPILFNVTFALLSMRFDYPGVLGIAVGPLFLLSSIEFLGSFEPSGWKLGGQLTPLAYVLWSLWLAALGVALLT